VPTATLPTEDASEQRLLERVAALKGSGRASEALSLLDAALDADPELRAARHQRVLLRNGAGDPLGALEDLDLLLAEGTDDDSTVELLAIRAACRIGQGDLVGSLEDVDRARALAPDEPQLLAQRALILAASGRTEIAEEDARRALELGYATAEVWVICAGARMQAGDVATAIVEYGRGLELQPNHPVCLLRRAQLLLRSDDLPGAERDLERLLTLHPTSADGLRTRAQLRLEQGDPRGVGDAQAALRAYPHDPGTWILLARLQGELRGDSQAAQKAASEAIELDPQRAPAWLLRGQAYAALARWQLAARDLRKAMELDPDDVEARVLLGHVQLDRRQASPQAALETLTAALELEPRHALATLFKGVALCRLKNPQQALAAFDRYLELGGEDTPTLHFNRAAAFSLLDDPQSAIREYALVLEKTPRDWQAWSLCAEQRLALGDTPGAVEDYQRALQALPARHETARKRLQAALEEARAGGE
jgi:tetratricopeptide (TPR) repeat protein